MCCSTGELNEALRCANELQHEQLLSIAKESDITLEAVLMFRNQVAYMLKDEGFHKAYRDLMGKSPKLVPRHVSETGKIFSISGY